MRAAITCALVTPSMPGTLSPIEHGFVTGDTSAPAGNPNGTGLILQPGIPFERWPSVQFQRVATLLQDVDERLVDRHQVGVGLALDNSSIHRAIQNGRLTQWIDFGGRARFWFTRELTQLFDAMASGYESEELRELVIDLERERLDMLSKIARLLACVDDVASSAEATASARAEKRLLTFDQVCLDGKGFSTMRLPYRRRHLDNLRSAGQFTLPVLSEPGALLRVDVRDVARLQIQSAIDAMVDRVPALGGGVVPRTDANV